MGLAERGVWVARVNMAEQGERDRAGSCAGDLGVSRIWVGWQHDLICSVVWMVDSTGLGYPSPPSLCSGLPQAGAP